MKDMSLYRGLFRTRLHCIRQKCGQTMTSWEGSWWLYVWYVTYVDVHIVSGSLYRRTAFSVFRGRSTIGKFSIWAQKCIIGFAYCSFAMLLDWYSLLVSRSHPCSLKTCRNFPKEIWSYGSKLRPLDPGPCRSPRRNDPGIRYYYFPILIQSLK